MLALYLMPAEMEVLYARKAANGWLAFCGHMTGGFDLGFERAGFETVWQVEIDEYCRRVLERHFPRAERFGDIRECGAHNLKPVDVICGGFPCQPVSLAGKGLAQSDERWLWPEFRRIVCELRPRFVVVENVPGLLTRGMGDVLGDLAASGFDAEWLCVSASDFGAPHLRERIWIVAYPMCDGYSGQVATNAAAPDKEWHDSAHWQNGRAIPSSLEPGCEDVAYAVCAGLQERYEQRSPATQRSRIISRSELVGARSESGREQWEAEPELGRVADGIPHRVDRLKSLGNAVVPQIAQYIAERIKAVMEA